MIKWIAAITYRPDLPSEACQRYWSEQHARLVPDLPGVKRYVQSYRERGEPYAGDAPYDGFASLWFETEAAARQTLSSPQMAAVRADAQNFADVASTRSFLAREVLMRDVPAQADALKLVTFNYRQPGLSPAMFQDYWENRHGQLVLRNFAALRRYVQNHALLSSYDAGAEPEFDGMLEAWLSSFKAFQAGVGTPELDAVRADEVNFIDPARFRFMFVRDRVFQ
jgi:uncharacterized protein (TIGR02118 family)